MSDGPVVYGLLAYKNSVLFTKVPFSLFCKPSTASLAAVSKLHPQSLSPVSYCETDAAILDLIQYYHLVNMCISARVSKSHALSTNINYTDSHLCTSPKSSQTGAAAAQTTSLSPATEASSLTSPRKKSLSPRKIRKFIMRPEISLLSFDREFLNQLMLQNFESPFDDQVSSGGSHCNAHTAVGADCCDDLDGNMIIELVHPDRFGSTKTKLYEILQSSNAMLLARDHPRETRRESFWKLFRGEKKN